MVGRAECRLLSSQGETAAPCNLVSLCDRFGLKRPTHRALCGTTSRRGGELGAGCKTDIYNESGSTNGTAVRRAESQVYPSPVGAPPHWSVLRAVIHGVEKRAGGGMERVR